MGNGLHEISKVTSRFPKDSRRYRSIARRLSAEIFRGSRAGRARWKHAQGDWIQLIGPSYDRTIYAFEVKTTAEQDEDFIRDFNSRRNQTDFHILFHNCADFARQVINFYYPKAIHRSLAFAWLEDGHFNPRSFTNSEDPATEPAVIAQQLETNHVIPESGRHGEPLKSAIEWKSDN
jgi:hypothetical protein